MKKIWIRIEIEIWIWMNRMSADVCLDACGISSGGYDASSVTLILIELFVGAPVFDFGAHFSSGNASENENRSVIVIVISLFDRISFHCALSSLSCAVSLHLSQPPS